MAILPSDIKLLLSGGTHNSEPANSIGGEASYQPIVGTMNNLFDNVLEDESEEGHTDYRCFYISNEHETDSFYTMLVYIVTQVPSGATIHIGTYLDTEIQRLTLRGDEITGGSLTLDFGEETTGAISWGGDKEVFRINLQNALNALSALGGVNVPDISYVPGSEDVYYLDVYFEGVDDNRTHPLLEVADLSLTGCDTAEIARIAFGGPVNTVASKLDFDTIAPNGVDFDAYDEGTPLTIGDLHAGDQVPIWVKRYTPAGSESLANDGFTLRIRGAIVE